MEGQIGIIGAAVALFTYAKGELVSKLHSTSDERKACVLSRNLFYRCALKLCASETTRVILWQFLRERGITGLDLNQGYVMFIFLHHAPI